MRDAFAAALGEEVERAVLLAGGASKEAWAVDAGGRELLIRRAAGGVIHQATLTLEHEFEVLQAAHEAGVKVPEPIAYLGEVEGREAFVMERIHGETIGRRIVKQPPSGLDLQLAEELAKIHAIPATRLPFLEQGDAIARFYDELDSVGEPHPAIELGLHWAKERLPRDRDFVVVHGDWRIGNVAVDEQGLVAVLDWEFAHLADPVEDLAWPLVRAWRFGADHLRLGGIAQPERYLERYAELTGREVTAEELLVWEVFGNVKWAIGCLTQSRRHMSGQERSVELAVLGRLAAEMEYELLDLIDRPRDRRARPPDPGGARRGRARVPAGGDPPPARRPPAEVPHARRDQWARDRRARAPGDHPAARGGLGARPPDPRGRRARERRCDPEEAGGGEAARLESALPGEVRAVRRRLILMRHGEVSYVDEEGAPVQPEDVPLTARGRSQAEAARDALAGVEFDLVVSSDLPRTLETAEIVAPGRQVEPWPELAEWRGGRLDAIPPDELKAAFVGALQVKDEAQRFLGGESLGEALDRVHPATRTAARAPVAHRARGPARRRQSDRHLLRPLGRPHLLRHLRAGAGLHQRA